MRHPGADLISGNEVDIGEVARETMDSLGQLFRERGVTLKSESPAHLPLLLADRDRLTQVMINLLSNAVKFVPGETGRVIVRVLENDGEVRVEVEDNGPGIAEAEREQLLKRGVRGDERVDGDGLGLAIVLEIVGAYNGEIAIEESELGGACISVSLRP